MLIVDAATFIFQDGFTRLLFVLVKKVRLVGILFLFVEF